jgi:hypothetical protein
MSQAVPTSFQILSWLMVLLGIVSCLFVALDIRRRQPQPMAVMNWVWPINALWAGLIGIWAYWAIGRTGPRSPQQQPARTNKSMDMAPRPFWQSVVSGTAHCGAGCSLADLVGPSCFALRRSPWPAA